MFWYVSGTGVGGVTQNLHRRLAKVVVVVEASVLPKLPLVVASAATEQEVEPLGVEAEAHGRLGFLKLMLERSDQPRGGESPIPLARRDFPSITGAFSKRVAMNSPMGKRSPAP